MDKKIKKEKSGVLFLLMFFSVYSGVKSL